MSYKVNPIQHSSYPDFVGLTGQENTPPGAYKTIHKWVDQAKITQDSFVLDLACSTGFSGREVNAYTGARVHGIDISRVSIDMARKLSYNKPLLTYEVADATKLPLPDSSFTHVLAGCNFGFISNREQARTEVARVLQVGGMLCVSSFYYIKTPPPELLERVKDVIGFAPGIERDYNYWKSFFATEFTLQFERVSKLKIYNNRKLERAVRQAIKTSPGLRKASDSEKDVARDRLLATRRVLNEHRRYQELSVAVWRLDD